MHPKISAQKLNVISIGILCFFAASFLWFIPQASQVELNANYAKLLSADNTDNHYRLFHRQVFGADDTLLIAIITPEQINANFLSKLQALTLRLNDIDDFIRVRSVSNAAVIKSDDDEINIDAIFDENTLANIHEQQAMDKLIAAMRQNSLLKNRYISQTHNSFIILAELPADYDNAKKVSPPAQLFRQQIQTTFSADTHYVQFAGIAFTRIALMSIMQEDMAFILPLALSLIALCLFFIYRHWLPIVISYILIAYSITASLAFMHALDIQLNQLTSIFPLISIVVIVANLLHFLQCYQQASQDFSTASSALINTLNTISGASIISCLTTAIGFFSLLISHMPILHEFGLVLGVNLLICALCLSLLLPSILYLSKQKLKAVKVYSFAKQFKFKPQYALHYLALAITLLISSLFLSPNSRFDFYLEDMLQESHPQILAAQALNNQFSGALPLEISLLGQAGDFKKAEHIARISQLQQWLENQGVHDSLSLANVLAELHHAFDQAGLPNDDALIAQYLLLSENSSEKIIQQLSQQHYGLTRIRAFMPDMGSIAFDRFQRDFMRYAQGLFAGTNIQVKITGEMPLVYQGFDRLTQELILSLALASLSILILIALIYRDLALFIASIFPNILPILLGLALYRLFDQGLNPLPAIAFCIGIGIAVDDTIHLFNRYSQALRNGLPPNQAIDLALSHTKPALILSSLVLTLGFLLFLFSGFTWNQELGLILSFIILSALIADLYLSPAFIQLLSKHPQEEQCLNANNSAQQK